MTEASELLRRRVFVFEASYLLDILDRMLLGTIFHERQPSLVKPMVSFLEATTGVGDVQRNSIQGGQSSDGAIGWRATSGFKDRGDLLEIEHARKLDQPKR